MSSAHVRSIKDLQRGRNDQDPASGSMDRLPSDSGGMAADDVDLSSRMSKLKALGEADKALIATLQRQLDELRTGQSSVQRNYEKLSEVYFLTNPSSAVGCEILWNRPPGSPRLTPCC